MGVLGKGETSENRMCWVMTSALVRLKQAHVIESNCMSTVH